MAASAKKKDKHSSHTSSFVHENNDNGSLHKIITSPTPYPAIPAAAVKERSFLVGKVVKPSPVYDLEFHRCFPDGVLHLFIGTWNMKSTTDFNKIEEFVLPEEEEFLQEVYVVGVQEACADLHAWEIKLQETLGTNHVLAQSVTHGVLHLAVFVRRDLIWFCTNFETSKVTTRIVSQYKTKGAAAVSFSCFGSTFLFVTAHFSAGENQVKGRFENFHKVCEKLHLPSDYKGVAKDINDRFDNVFWFGDFNFRVLLPDSKSKTSHRDPSTYSIEQALQYDELNKAISEKIIFSGFCESKISFMPTYKFDVNTDDYDTSPKARAPSYTDRILFKSQTRDDIKNIHYKSVMNIQSSDHKPVYGMFHVVLKPGNERVISATGNFNREVYTEAAKRRANLSNEKRSQVCLLV